MAVVFYILSMAYFWVGKETFVQNGNTSMTCRTVERKLSTLRHQECTNFTAQSKFARGHYNLRKGTRAQTV